MECIARIKVEEFQTSSKIHTTSHRKWDGRNQQKITQKLFKIGENPFKTNPKMHQQMDRF